MLRLPVSAIALLICLTGCAGQAQPVAASAPVTYVAIGDSYTAAPYVVSTDVAEGCLRSQSNYPTLVTAAIKADLTDVSCGGAETIHVTKAQHTLGSASVPPQIKAVHRKTELVTVGLGGNDGKLFGQLSVTCPITGPDGARFGKGDRCGFLGAFKTRPVLRTMQHDLTGVLKLIEEKAPEAKVLVIGYPRLLGDRGCKILPVAARDVARVQLLAVQLRDAQRAAARAAGAAFIDLHAASKGHDACARVPWVNGVHTDQTKGAALHPTLAGQQAMAAAIESQLAGDGS